MSSSRLRPPACASYHPKAKLDGYSEGVILDSQGFVAEGSGENLFAVRDNVPYTAPLAAGILNGITNPPESGPEDASGM